ncbi:MAG TPA: hypothetical protein VE818_04700 [Nitrososphaeraceae archaeon]|nr:hypothetical protein [Nitrososphaeraceae archaeon]
MTYKQKYTKPTCQQTQIPLGPLGLSALGDILSYRGRGQNSCSQIIVYAGDDDYEYLHLLA